MLARRLCKYLFYRTYTSFLSLVYLYGRGRAQPAPSHTNVSALFQCLESVAMSQTSLMGSSAAPSSSPDSRKRAYSAFSSTRTEIETRLIRQAALNEEFRHRLQQSPQAVWEEEFKGSDLVDLKLRVFEDTDDTLFLVVPWHADDFRKVLDECPRDVWKREFGTDKLNGFMIRILEEPTDEFYLVLHRHEEIPEKELEDLDVPEFEQHDTVSSPALRYLRLRRFTQWRPRNRVERILYYIQAQGLNRVMRLPIVSKFLNPIYKMRSHVYQIKHL